MANLSNNNKRRKRKPGKPSKSGKPTSGQKRRSDGARPGGGRPGGRPGKPAARPQAPDDGKMRLNRYISSCGVCSRREADVLIQAGAISVNGEIASEFGLRIDPSKDVVQYDGATLRMNDLRYVLLNKPKNYTISADDPSKPRSVFQLMKGACKEPIVPIGRMDRQTSGLLIFTNDGDLIRRLTNPNGGAVQLFHVSCAEKIKPTHIETMLEGVRMGDGMVQPTKIEFVGQDPHQVGVEIKTGRNRAVRGLFEQFGYTITKLDRVKIGGLSKKDLPRGHYRHLTEQEVQFLAMIR